MSPDVFTPTIWAPELRGIGWCAFTFAALRLPFIMSTICDASKGGREGGVTAATRERREQNEGMMIFQTKL